MIIEGFLDSDDDEKDEAQCLEDICSTLSGMTDQELSLLPGNISDQLMLYDDIPDDLRARLRRSRIK